LATDGIYLYLYISSANGGMFKIGTGKGASLAGKIYLYSSVNKQEDVSWIFLNNHLYVRASSSPLGQLEILCPNSFKQQGTLQLFCPDVFGHPSLQIVNRNYPLLTDGEFIYIIGKKLYNQKVII